MDTIPKQRHKLIEVFLERNSKINLSAIRSVEGVYHKHILDALELTKLDLNVLPLLTTKGSDWERAGVREKK